MLSILKLCGNAYNVFREHPLFPITESVHLLPDILSDCISHLVIPFCPQLTSNPWSIETVSFFPLYPQALT